jgi:hypothetical protein
MSIEAFFGGHPADGYFAQSVSWPSGERRSPVTHMSDILIQEGRAGLAKIGRAYIEAIEDADIETITSLDRPLAANSASVYTGITLRSIEDVIRSGNFDQETYNSRLKFAFTGTYLNPVQINNPKIEPVDQFNYRSLIKAASVDKTFASFFVTDLDILPKGMKDFLLKSEMIKPIVRFIIPDYMTRARLLIEANAS